jgi:hypothetical protein
MVDAEREGNRRLPQLVWEDNELQREQVRGVFALGVLASIIAYLAYRSNLKLPATNASASNLFGFLDITSFILLTLWGVYIVMIAISMTFWSAKSPFGTILRACKSFGRFCFYLGSFTTLIYGLYYIPLLYFDAFQRMSQRTQFILVVILVVGLTFFILLRLVYFTKRRLGKSQQATP